MIESFVEPGERVIWTDRFDPARPRRRPMTFLEIIGGEAKILIGLVCLAATALLVAILDADPQTRLLALLAALILTPAAWLYGRRLARLLKIGAIEKVDFLLTHRRVLALEPRMRSPEVLEVERRIDLAEVSIPGDMASTAYASDVPKLDIVTRTAMVKDIAKALEKYRIEGGLAVPQETLLIRAAAE